MVGSFRPEYMGRREEGILLGHLSNISARSQGLNPMPGSMSQGFEPGCSNFELGNNIIDLSFPRSTNHELGGPPHVAQQDRRDKLRILDSDSSPHATNQSSVAGFSSLMLHQASHSLTPQQTKNYEHPPTTRGFSGAGIGDEMPGVYDTHMMFTEMFNFPTGAELLGHVSPKGTAVLHQAAGCGDDGNVSASKINANPNLGNWKFVNGHQPQSNSDSPLNLVAPKYNIPTASGSEHSMAFAGGLQFNSLGVLKEGNMGIHDAMQLYLMNPAGNGDYSQPLIQANMLITSNGMAGHQASEPHKHFVEHPLHFPATFQQSVTAEAAAVSNNGSQGLSNVRESPWEGGANELLLLPDNHGHLQSNQLLPPQLNWTSRQVAGSLSGSQWNQNPLEGKVCDDRSHGQGLSLSLSSLQPNNSSSQMQPQAFEGRIAFSSQDIFNRSNVLQGAKAKSEDLFNNKGLAAYFSSVSQNPLHRGSTMNSIGLLRGHANLLKNSKYLKPAQQLLIEFCNVGRRPKQPDHRKTLDGSSIDVVQSRPSSTSTGWVPLAGGKVAGNGGSTSSSAVPPATRNDGAREQLLLSGDRFELQRRRTKLLSILDEIDRRYTHYCDQMQMVVTSFEAVAGIGAASPYTALALKAMSRHFRCLRDAVSGQIRATSEALGEKDPCTIAGVTRGETPRLRFLEQSLRQQRTLHQVGMLEQEAWRPQRGLPERSVSVLRAWLFEHFLHPYPSDADKHFLARQTGLSRSQVSNWFINARVRLWKPMVEEMYQEEAKEAEPGAGKDKSPAGKTITSNDENQMNTNGKMTDKQSIFQSEDGLKHELGGSPSVNTGRESSSATSFPLESQPLEANFDESSMSRKTVRGLDSSSTMRTQMSSKNDHPSILDGLHDSRLFNQDRNIKIQGAGVAGLDFSSYNHNGSSTGTMYDGHRDLTNPTQFGTGDVSLTLGLRHSGAALSLPVTDQQKYDNGLYLSRS